MFNTLDKLNKHFFNRLKKSAEDRVIKEAKKRPVESTEVQLRRKADREESQIQEILARMENKNDDDSDKEKMNSNKLSSFNKFSK